MTMIMSKVLIQQLRRYHAPRNILKLTERGLIQEYFPPDKGHELAAHLEAAPRVVYAGFDPTANCLHVGNLLVTISLMHCQRAGHKAIALIGGATGRIGDPSGKVSERPQLRPEVVEENCQGIKSCLETLFKNHAEYFGDSCKHDLGQTSFEIVNNHDWYKDLKLLDFLANTGRQFRINHMLKKKSVADRLEMEDVGMSLTEFTYQTFQAYDWLHLLQSKDCTVQVGGSDQMGNIVAGHDLIGKSVDSQVYGVTLPLVTSESGEKLGKTAGNPVWLSTDKTSYFDFYQFFIRLSDKDASKLIRMFTFLPLAELQDLEQKHNKAPEKRLLQQKLAQEVTQLVHGPKGVDVAKKTTKIMYERDMKTIGSLPSNELQVIFQEADYVRILFSPGLCMLDLAMKVGCFRTEKDAIRIMAAGGFHVNEVKVQNTEEVVMPGMHILPNQTSLLRVGKKNFYLVEWIV